MFGSKKSTDNYYKMSKHLNVTTFVCVLMLIIWSCIITFNHACKGIKVSYIPCVAMQLSMRHAYVAFC